MALLQPCNEAESFCRNSLTGKETQYAVDINHTSCTSGYAVELENAYSSPFPPKPLKLIIKNQCSLRAVLSIPSCIHISSCIKFKFSHMAQIHQLDYIFCYTQDNI